MGNTVTVRYHGYLIEGVTHPTPYEVLRKARALWHDGPAINDKYRLTDIGAYVFEDERAQAVYMKLIEDDALAVLREHRLKGK